MPYMRYSLLIIILLLLPISVSAQNISVETRLTNNDGTANAGTYTTNYTIINETSDQIFFNSSTTTTDNNAYFQKFFLLPFFGNSTLWHRWQINGEDTGYQQIAYVPYAINALYLHGYGLDHFATNDSIPSAINDTFVNVAGDTMTGTLKAEADINLTGTLYQGTAYSLNHGAHVMQTGGHQFRVWTDSNTCYRLRDEDNYNLFRIDCTNHVSYIADTLKLTDVNGNIYTSFESNGDDFTIDSADTLHLDGTGSVHIDIAGSEVVNFTSSNMTIPHLTNCDTIDTNADGTLVCGTDGGGGGGTNDSIFFNKTTSTMNANLSYNGLTGYEAGNAICDSNYTGTHLCSWNEVVNTYRLKNVSQILNWTGSAYVIGGPSKFTPADYFVNDGHGFTDATGTDSKCNAWSFTNNKGLTGECNSLLPLACCKVW